MKGEKVNQFICLITTHLRHMGEGWYISPYMFNLLAPEFYISILAHPVRKM
jgi:hypothetical protein